VNELGRYFRPGTIGNPGAPCKPLDDADTLQMNSLTHSNSLAIWLAVLGIIVLALPFRVIPLSRGLGEDELFTAVNFVEVPSLRTTVSESGGFNNHIGYSLAARTAERVFGRSEEMLRFPALLLGLASIAGMFLLCRRIVGTGFALLASFLLAISPPHIDWSVQARGYSGMIFFSILSSYLFLRLLERENGSTALLFVFANVAGIYIHLYLAFVVATQVVMVMYWVLRRRGTSSPMISFGAKRLLVVCFVATAVGSLIVYTPALASFMRSLVGRGRSAFSLVFPWQVLKYLSGTENPIFTAVVALAAAGGCVDLRRRSPDTMTYILMLFIGPLFLMWFMRPFDLYPRFFIYWLPFYVLLIVAGVRLAWEAGKKAGWRRNSLRASAALAILAIVLHWTLTWQKWVPDEGYREVSRAAEFGADPEAAFCAIGGSRSIWKYYIKKPMLTPMSVADLQQIASAHSELRCLYYKAGWQNTAQTEIADFLFQHARWAECKNHLWFVYRVDESRR
jgi:mannosyltransferase